jgi:hypothetical protein
MQTRKFMLFPAAAGASLCSPGLPLPITARLTMTWVKYYGQRHRPSFNTLILVLTSMMPKIQLRVVQRCKANSPVPTTSREPVEQCYAQTRRPDYVCGCPGKKRFANDQL